MNFDPVTAAARGLARCHTCGNVEPVAFEHCALCGAHLRLRKPASLERTVALTIGAALLYVPANLLPVLRIETSLQGDTQNTIMSGVVQFWQDGDYPVAAIIFTASVIIPFLKVAAIVALCWGVKTGRYPRLMSRIYRMTEYIGRWSMVDVFVVAVLVGIVQLGSVMRIEPGAGILAFAGVVILTMLAAHAFDPRLIWDAAAARGHAPPIELPENESDPAADIRANQSSSHA